MGCKATIEHLITFLDIMWIKESMSSIGEILIYSVGNLMDTFSGQLISLKGNKNVMPNRIVSSCKPTWWRSRYQGLLWARWGLASMSKAKRDQTHHDISEGTTPVSIPDHQPHSHFLAHVCDYDQYWSWVAKGSLIPHIFSLAYYQSNEQVPTILKYKRSSN